KRPGIVIGLHRDVLDAEVLLMLLRVDDRGDIELQPVQIELQAAPGHLPLHRGAEIVDVELRGLLWILGLDVDVPDLHGHARLLRLGAALASGRGGKAWQHGIANSTATALSFVVSAKAGAYLPASWPLLELAQASNRDGNGATLHRRGFRPAPG